MCVLQLAGDFRHGSRQAQTAFDADYNHVQRVWEGALRELESMTEGFARVVEKVSAVGDDQLRLMFPADSQLAIRRCEMPEHRTAISQAVSQQAGIPITLAFELAPAKVEPKRVEPAVSKPTRAQRMREIEANAFVKSCVDLFDAEIVRIDKPE